MNKTPEAPNRAAFLTALNTSVKEQEQYLQALKTAQDIVAKAMLVQSGGNPIKPHRQRRKRSGNTNGSRTQMLKTILANAPGPVSVDEIVEELAKHGVRDEKKYVNSTLSYLKRTSQAKNVERGQWVGVTQKQAA